MRTFNSSGRETKVFLISRFTPNSRRLIAAEEIWQLYCVNA